MADFPRRQLRLYFEGHCLISDSLPSRGNLSNLQQTKQNTLYFDFCWKRRGCLLLISWASVTLRLVVSHPSILDRLTGTGSAVPGWIVIEAGGSLVIQGHPLYWYHAFSEKATSENYLTSLARWTLLWCVHISVIGQKLGWGLRGKNTPPQQHTVHTAVVGKKSMPVLRWRERQGSEL